MKTICFHHNDTDGRAAGALVRFRYDKCIMCEMDYQNRFPSEIVEKNDKVFIVDFSLKPADMKSLLEITKDVTWIDHHQTAIEDLAEFADQIPGIRREGECGALLTWKYFKMGPIPRALTFIDDWDVFTRKFDPDTTKFHYGLEIYNQHPISTVWYQIFFSLNKGQFVSTILRKGATIMQFIQNNHEDLLKLFGYEIDWEGHRCIVLNIPRGGSLVFDSVKNKYSVMIIYVHNGKKFKVSMYTDDKSIDVSRICHKHGGGGHPGAARFVCDQLPWINKNNGD